MMFGNVSFTSIRDVTQTSQMRKWQSFATTLLITGAHNAGCRSRILQQISHFWCVGK
jgi:hypothetical protein